MKKAGIVTLYGNVNHGNKLQNYAVSELLKNKNLHTSTFTYKVRNLSKKRFLLKLFGIQKEKTIEVQRRKKFEAFSDKWIADRQEIDYYKDNSNLNKDYDLFVVGSDQVWHAWIPDPEELDYYMLRFADRKKRMALSPSFGFEEFPADRKEQFKTGLLGFDNLSCREERGCQLIEELTGQKAICLLDPTMLLSAEQWDSIQKKPEAELPDKFVLCYFLGGISKETQKNIKDFAQSHNFGVVDVLNPDTEFYTSSPDEFVYLIKNAEYIYTDSFHACVFSMLYHKKFTVFGRQGSLGTQMQSRIDTLLKKFGIEERKNCDNFEKEIDYENVDLVLSRERDKANQYIEMCLEKILK